MVGGAAAPEDSGVSLSEYLQVVHVGATLGLQHVDGVVGMMYTQWTTGHERMKEFFQLTRDYPAWLEEGHEQRAIVRER